MKVKLIPDINKWDVVYLDHLSEAKRHEILRLSLSELVEKLQSGELKAVDVLHAYQWQALAVHKKTNCLVEPILEAEALALACDAGQRPGPLCGVPVSLKDCYGLKGYDCTVGLARWIDRPFEEDCDIVQVLKKQGAVPFVKTNVPQTMMSVESTNPIFGLTVNPHDTTRTAGGSSGGEAALIAGGGSILGFGMDIGGSVRIPAAMCGIYSLKPVDLRLSEAGCHPILCGQKGVPNCYGPMARDVESLTIAMKALTVDSTMYEVAPATPPVPFRSQIYEDKKRLKIGFFLNNGVFRAFPCMERGVLKARDALEAAGHQLVEYNIGSMGKETYDLFTRNLSADGGAELMCHMKNDAVDGAVRGLKAVYDLNGFQKRIRYHIMRRNHPLYAANLKGFKRAKVSQYVLKCITSVFEYWNLIAETERMRTRVMKEWQSLGMDAVVSPGFGYPALPFATNLDELGATSYTAMYNMLNFTV
ncbi:Fatty-acid amide hydrolase 1 [Lamellibrachia satsuma]|nr:Fatty-acid amide hydrolase 1 [Lamellibrachia satsuma]